MSHRTCCTISYCTVMSFSRLYFRTLINPLRHGVKYIHDMEPYCVLLLNIVDV